MQTISAQQILASKLLELPAVELEERVRAELLDNPALEEGKEKNEEHDEDADLNKDEEGNPVTESAEEMSLGDYRTEDDIPDYRLRDNNRTSSAAPEDIPFSDNVSFYETLKEQLDMHNLSDEEKQIGEYIIGSLDDDGLLRKSLETIGDELAIYQGIYADKETLEGVLSVIQQLDPAGIGARTLQECLLLQIDRREDSPLKQVERDIIEKCIEEFTKKNKEKILQRLSITEDVYAKALTELTKLNPRPGSSMGEVIGKGMQQIIPDFIVETGDGGEVTFTLCNYNVPELRLSREFTDMLSERTKGRSAQSRESREAALFLKQKIDAAQGFINALRQRQRTLTVTMQAIIKLQLPFFQEGDEALLRPMNLKDVASLTKLDISTVSRVTGSKYVQTDYGIYPLKYFFSDGFTTESGEELSVREIKRILRECIEGEDKTSPLTDDELAEALKSKGFPIARRTVAKYRMGLGIPVARMRRT